jgi:hypothetical protein
MAHSPLELPPIPEVDCTQARFATLLLDQEVAEYNALEVGDYDGDSPYVVTEELLQGRARRLHMTADFLIDYVSTCETCTSAEVDCPMKPNFDFIVGRLVAINEDL